MGRTDAGIAVRLCALFGLRIEECAKVRAEHLTDALRYGELAVIGKRYLYYLYCVWGLL